MLKNYKNGNADITIEEDGSRFIEYDDTLQLDYPLNVDIRVMTKCAFGAKADGTPGFCSFCHESASQIGGECDYGKLKSKLDKLPSGIELAIGANELTQNLYDFLIWAKMMGFICNITINQGHIRRDIDLLREAIKCDYIKGLGISYRSGLKWDIPTDILEYEHTVFHVIAGIDNIVEVDALAAKGVMKVLVLGEKDFGFNKGHVDLTSRLHKEWVWWVSNLFSRFKAVSFDNLALVQLRIHRFFTSENWAVFNQGEHSFFVDSVNGFYHPSSRSYDKVDWNTMSMKDYFQNYVDKR